METATKNQFETAPLAGDEERASVLALSADARLLVLLPVGDHRLALEANAVREVVTVTTVTPLPNVSEALRGAVAVRGSLLPLYDVTAWCGATPFDVDLAFRFGTILETEAGSFALETAEHPTISMCDATIAHRHPLVVEGDVCVGVHPLDLLHELTSVATQMSGEKPAHNEEGLLR